MKDASTDPAQIARWWRQWPDANVAVATGRASGLVVVDIDPDHGGAMSMQSLVEQHGRLPHGPRVRTGSGGWHLYFLSPAADVRNSVGKVGVGVDVRSDDGYVIAPPSTHACGRHYLWSHRGRLPNLPDWLERLIVDQLRDVRRPPIRIYDSLNGWASAAFRNEIDRVRSASDGTRNHTLNRAAFSLGQIAGAGLLDPGEVESHLLSAALNCGLGEREARLTLWSGLSAGLERPRGPARPINPTRHAMSIDHGVDIA